MITTVLRYQKKHVAQGQGTAICYCNKINNKHNVVYICFTYTVITQVEPLYEQISLPKYPERHANTQLVYGNQDDQMPYSARNISYGIQSPITMTQCPVYQVIEL